MSFGISVIILFKIPVINRTGKRRVINIIDAISVISVCDEIERTSDIKKQITMMSKIYLTRVNRAY